MGQGEKMIELQGPTCPYRCGCAAALLTLKRALSDRPSRHLSCYSISPGAFLITGPVPEGPKVARTPERLTKWLILGCLRVEHSVGQFTQANQTRHQRFVTPILYRHVTRRNDFVRVYRSRGLISLEDIDYLFHFPCTIKVDWDTQAF